VASLKPSSATGAAEAISDSEPKILVRKGGLFILWKPPGWAVSVSADEKGIEMLSRHPGGCELELQDWLQSKFADCSPMSLIHWWRMDYFTVLTGIHLGQFSGPATTATTSRPDCNSLPDVFGSSISVCVMGQCRSHESFLKSHCRKQLEAMGCYAALSPRKAEQHAQRSCQWPICEVPITRS